MGYKLEDFNTDMEETWYSIEDGGEARKIEISIFNPLVPTYYRDKADDLLNDFIKEHKIRNPINDIDSVSGIIAAFIDKDVALEKKYYISVFIWVKDTKFQDCIMEGSILPTDECFLEFKEFIMMELENIIFGK